MDIMDRYSLAFNKTKRSQLIDTRDGLAIKLKHYLVTKLGNSNTDITTEIILLNDVVLTKGVNNLYLKGKFRNDVVIYKVEVIPDIFIDGDNVTLLRKNNLCISIFIETIPKQEVLLKAGKPSFRIIANRFITNYESEEKFRNVTDNDTI